MPENDDNNNMFSAAEDIDSATENNPDTLQDSPGADLNAEAEQEAAAAIPAQEAQNSPATKQDSPGADLHSSEARQEAAAADTAKPDSQGNIALIAGAAAGVIGGIHAQDHLKKDMQAADASAQEAQNPPAATDQTAPTATATAPTATATAAATAKPGFQGNIALITGAASGMGRICAQRCLAKGMQVACLDRNEEALQELYGQQEKAHAFPCDIADTEQVAQIVAQIESTLGAPDCIVNAAAMMPAKLLEEMPAADACRLMDINYGGTVNLITAVLPSLLKRRTGQLVAFGSVAGAVPTPHIGAYCATKAAVNSYVEILDREIAGRGVHVLLVCPPPTNTPLVDQALDAKNIREAREKGMMAAPETIVDAIEEGLRRGKSAIFPGQARWLHWMRRFTPRLLWWIILRSNK